MKRPSLYCCFTWIVFIELNFTVVFQLIRKTWDVWFVGGVGEWEILRNEERVGGGGGGEVLVIGDDIEMGGLIPLYRPCSVIHTNIFEASWNMSPLLLALASYLYSFWLWLVFWGGQTNYSISTSHVALANYLLVIFWTSAKVQAL